MKRLLGLLVGFVLAPCAMAGVVVLSSATGGGGGAGAWGGVGSAKASLSDLGGTPLTSAMALVGTGMARPGSEQVGVVPVAMDLRDEGLSPARGKRADREALLVGSGPESSYESYAMVAAGLCAIGFLAQRRKLV